MAIRIVRLGTARAKGEGVRLGTVRRPPRGVKKADYASRDFYDAWLPELAPSAGLVKWLFAQPEVTPAVWRRFEKGYRGEMKAPERERLLVALAAFSRDSDFSVGCYCEDYGRCHRSILRRLLQDHGARIADDA
ncbi:MAG: DUF488 domain-containing protein [Usitatibacter sp.]